MKEFKKPKTYPVPTEVGTYLVRIREKGAGEEEERNDKFYWNGLATIYGWSPYLKIKAWNFVKHETDFLNFPQYVEWGDRVFTEADFMARPASKDYSDYNSDKILDRYE
jgi:hypothetical protein